MKMNKLAKKIYKARYKKSETKKARKNNNRFIATLYEVGQNPDLCFENDPLREIELGNSSIHVAGRMKQWMADDLYTIVNTLLEKANATKVLDTANSFTLQFNADDDEINLIVLGSPAINTIRIMDEDNGDEFPRQVNIVDGEIVIDGK